MIFKNILFSILALFLCNSIGAQILNIDREVGADTAIKSWSASITSSFSSDKLKGNLIDFSNRTEFDKRLKNNYVIIGQLNTDLTFLEKDIIQNEGYFQLRYRDFDKRKLSLESYLQYQWNGSLGMAYRKVIGSNARVLNCKLVRFNPRGLKTFISWHGRGNYNIDPSRTITTDFEDLLMSYAYDDTHEYDFLIIEKEDEK